MSRDEEEQAHRNAPWVAEGWARRGPSAVDIARSYPFLPGPPVGSLSSSVSSGSSTWSHSSSMSAAHCSSSQSFRSWARSVLLGVAALIGAAWLFHAQLSHGLAVLLLVVAGLCIGLPVVSVAFCGPHLACIILVRAARWVIVDPTDRRAWANARRSRLVLSVHPA